jgi:hypothetical protein
MTGRENTWYALVRWFAHKISDEPPNSSLPCLHYIICLTKVSTLHLHALFSQASEPRDMIYHGVVCLAPNC